MIPAFRFFGYIIFWAMDHKENGIVLDSSVPLAQ